MVEDIAAILTKDELPALGHAMGKEQLAAPARESSLAIDETELTGIVLAELVQALGVHYADHHQYIQAIMAQ